MEEETRIQQLERENAQLRDDRQATEDTLEAEAARLKRGGVTRPSHNLTSTPLDLNPPKAKKNVR